MPNAQLREPAPTTSEVASRPAVPANGDRLKIDRITTHLIETPIPPAQRVESGAGPKVSRQMCLIEVHTIDGRQGIGSPSGPYDLGILKRLIESVLAPMILGSDARDFERTWHDTYHGEIARNVGASGVGIAALSGIEMAIWDLRGQASGTAVHDLLGGRFYPAGVRAYASSIYWDLSPAAAADQAEQYVGDGFTAVKLKVGREPHQDIARINAIRDRIGPGVELLVDANQAMSRHEALSMLPALEEAGVYWFEEPISVHDVEGHALLCRARRSVRIATGENLYLLKPFVELIRQEAVDVLQADASRAGGLAEVRRISALATAHHREWNPHTFNDLLTVLANLHLVMASPHLPMFEWDVTYNELMTSVFPDNALSFEDGRLDIGACHGLGATVDWEFVRAHPWTGRSSIGPGHGGSR